MGINNNSLQETANNRRMYILKDSIDSLGKTLLKQQKIQRKETDKKIKALEEKVTRMEQQERERREREEFEMY